MIQQGVWFSAIAKRRSNSGALLMNVIAALLSLTALEVVGISPAIADTPAATSPATVATPAPNFPPTVRIWSAVPNRTYYIDGVGGNDASSGLSPNTAWQTLDKVNTGTFAPGDRILLKAGGHWTGFLSPGGSGASGEPISISRYGRGPDPSINAEGRYLATLYIRNGEYLDISDLDISNTSPTPIPTLTGVTFELKDFGTAHGIRLHNLFVHDVDGSDVKADGGGKGICCRSSGDAVRTCYDGLTIDHNHVVHTDRDGINVLAYYQRPTWPMSTHVVITDNLLEDIGGDGIVPLGCDGCVIAHNVLRGGRMRAQDYAAGIWPWSCDNTVVEYNEVSGMKGTLDGEGFDSDYNCRNTLIEYNYSHDNDGGFMLICDDGSKTMPWNIGNSGTVIRYNISVNDSTHTFNITGPCQNTKIYNNVFYQGAAVNAPFVTSGNWGGGWPDQLLFANNIFYVTGKSQFQLGAMTDVTFMANAYWGRIDSLPQDPSAVLTDPRLTDPGSASVKGYLPQPSSPLIGAGTPIATGTLSDFWGNPVQSGTKITIGAGQVSESHVAIGSVGGQSAMGLRP